MLAIHMEIRKYFELNGSETYEKLMDAAEIEIKRNSPVHPPKWLKIFCSTNNIKCWQSCTATRIQTYCWWYSM